MGEIVGMKMALGLLFLGWFATIPVKYGSYWYAGRWGGFERAEPGQKNVQKK